MTLYRLLRLLALRASCMQRLLRCEPAGQHRDGKAEIDFGVLVPRVEIKRVGRDGVGKDFADPVSVAGIGKRARKEVFELAFETIELEAGLGEPGLREQ